MKRNLLILAAAFAAFSAFGKGATQEWVLRQLAALGRVPGSSTYTAMGMVPTTWVDDQEGGSAECSIKTEIGKHPALKVVASTVAEIPVGTFYARDDQGVYHNEKNTLLPTIYAAPYTANRETTNSLGMASTSSVRMGNFWATDTTGKAWRMGIDGDTIVYCGDDRTRYIAIRSTAIPERAVSVLLPKVSARLSIRGMLALAFPAARAANDEVVYTINGETTVTVGQITFTRKNKFGKETTITFTPEGLQGVYNGPTGPFDTKEQAQKALGNLDNWNFGDWDTVWNDLGMSRMTREEFEKSDVWKQLVGQYQTEKKEVIIEKPGVPAHPCPAPDDFWEYDPTANDWKVNTKYRAADTPYDYNREVIEEWRGRNECKCDVVGCGNFGVSQHRVGRVQQVNGQLMTTDDVAGGDGCKCCVRCVKYGGDPYVTIDEYDNHRASGEGAGFCGCACGRYTDENENEWSQDYHNRPPRTGGKDFACLCYCGRAKAANGEFVQHLKYAGDSPWCHEVCGSCERVEDEERYIAHNWPAFDTRHVTLREPTWEDHTPRSEAEGGANTVADPTYYQRCGCACGVYDEWKTGGLPAEFGAFHQPSRDSCKCSCGQVHNKNKVGDNDVDPFPCSDICAVCKKVKDEDSEAKFNFDGGEYDKLVMRDPDKEDDHTPDSSDCGCKCYQSDATRYEWSVGPLTGAYLAIEAGKPKWHQKDDDGCACKCGEINQTGSPEGIILWRAMHTSWATRSLCPLVCEVCHKLCELGDEAEEKDHEPSAEKCGCKCEVVTAETTNEKFHELRQQSMDCLCPCEKFHDGEWKKCGETLKVCTLNPEHTEGTGEHAFAGGPGDSLTHPCKCGNEKQNHVWSEWAQTSARPHLLIGRRTCTVSGCGQIKIEERECLHEGSWSGWKQIGVYDGGALLQRRCQKCSFVEEVRRDFDGMMECDAEIDYHVPAEESCGCKCGHYGTDGKTHDDQQYHKWNPEEKIDNIANCHCKCGKKHEFRAGCACPMVCGYCKEIRKDGSRAGESDHNPVSASERRCGCRCGYYGVSDQHVSAGRAAVSDRLHIQSKENNNSKPSAPAYCQCYGKDGTGGRRHWHYSRSATCPDVCTYVRTGETLGHRAADHSPSTDFIKATPENHVGKTDHTSGCGCKCGLCTKDNAADWVRNPALHQYNTSQEDRCHCACDEKVLCGDTMFEGEPHTFPITGKICTCTCGKKHKPDWLNACGLCSKCGRIWRNGRDFDASVAGNHLWNNGGCYCDGGCVVNGSKILHTQGHQFYKNKCVCLCGEETRPHLTKAIREYLTDSGNACYQCGAVFRYYRVRVVCTRCGQTLEGPSTVMVGEHAEDCGQPKPQPQCSHCLCTCITRGGHPSCNGHYCAACCYKAPEDPERPVIDDPDNPVDPDNPDDPDNPYNPTPADPYEVCTHPKTERVTWDFTWVCEQCNASFRNWGEHVECALCGKRISGASNSEGAHGPPCSTNTEDKPTHECNQTTCGAALAGGGTCKEVFCSECQSCPNATSHANYHGGNGGSGGGNLDDI